MAWENATLGDISSLITKGTTPTSIGFKFIETGINFIKVESIDLNGNFISSKFASISDQCHESLKRSKLEEGDILFSIAGALGRTALVTDEILPANTNQAIAIIRLKKNVPITNNFVILALTSGLTTEQIGKNQGGVAQQNLSLGQLKTFEIPLPPLETQARIVSILDSAFADIERARANAEKNLKNARELFNSYLNKVFTEGGDGWEHKKILDLSTKLGDGLHGTPKYTNNGEYHFINGNNLSDGYIVIKEKTKSVSKEEYYKHKKNLNDRTILVSINGTLGNVAFYRDEKVILGKSACYFNLKADVNKDFVKFVIQSPVFQSYAMKEATGATIKNVSLKSMRNFKLPVPSLRQQTELVDLFKSINRQTKQLVTTYENKLKSLDELKQSLLQKAFSGELTKEDEGIAA